MDIGKSGVFGRHEVIQGDQSDIADLQRVAARVGPAKAIIDDGSHHPVHQFETFNDLFSNILEPGGVYIIEDVECNYWHPGSSVYGYRIWFFSAIDSSTKLIDPVDAESSGRNNNVGISTIG